jgi:hypothetical protein
MRKLQRRFAAAPLERWILAMRHPIANIDQSYGDLLEAQSYSGIAV